MAISNAVDERFSFETSIVSQFKRVKYDIQPEAVYEIPKIDGIETESTKSNATALSFKVLKEHENK